MAPVSRPYRLKGAKNVMTEPEHVGSADGGSTEQHIQGLEETGTFLTDESPGSTPANGSSNAGINQTSANRAVSDRDPEEMPKS
ncbi:hypothetical protein L3i22_043470 [Actinoplanes sp. L3-i22]|nr:hypothetical protein L3i22_043470 [Actinoplanes sp. L3-i22]